MRNYFYFSQTQKTGVIVLLCLIVVLIAVSQSLPHFTKQKWTEDAAFMQEAAQFKASLKDISPRTFHERTTNFQEKNLTVFNPNTLDSVGFISLGIRPRVAQSIIRYRERGGRFRTPEDFAKIYGISESQFNELRPYIVIPAENQRVQQPRTAPERREFKRETIIVELNSADTTELKKIRGIGSITANRIVERRERLGGFVDIEQLKEIRGITPETFDGVAEFVTVDASQITKIPINKSTIDELRAHPYLNFRTAKAIYEQRKNLRKLLSRKDLENLPDLPPETLEKILPYLSFE